MLSNENNSFWELIFSKSYENTYRGRVPGGWLVKCYWHAGTVAAGALQFVSDDKGVWEVQKSCDWEKVQTDKNPNFACQTYRLKVHEGWLVRDGYRAANLNLSLHMAYISDPNHTWKL